MTSEFSEIWIAVGSGALVQILNVAARRLAKINTWKAAMDRINTMHQDILDYEEDTRKLSIALSEEKHKNELLEAELRKYKK